MAARQVDGTGRSVQLAGREMTQREERGIDRQAAVAVRVGDLGSVLRARPRIH
jgi:hypothetical protein